MREKKREKIKIFLIDFNEMMRYSLTVSHLNETTLTISFERNIKTHSESPRCLSPLMLDGVSFRMAHFH